MRIVFFLIVGVILGIFIISGLALILVPGNDERLFFYEIEKACSTGGGEYSKKRSVARCRYLDGRTISKEWKG